MTNKQSHHIAVSSLMLDEITTHILSAGERGLISLPEKLGPNALYNRFLNDLFRKEDCNWMRLYVESLNLSSTQLCVLDSIARWTFRNSSGQLRAAIGLLGTHIGRFVATTFRDTVLAATDTADLTSSFVAESTWVMRRIIRSSVIVGAIDAKIPMTEFRPEFDALAALPEADRQWDLKEERDQMRLYLVTTNPTSFFDVNAMPRREYAARRLIQMLKSASEYKREDGFNRLRSLLSNGAQAAMVIRMLSTNDPNLSRLASDVLDHFHSIDRLLNANGTAANALLVRMSRDEIVYDEILTLGSQQHRIIAVEFAAALIMFSHLLKVAGYKFNGNKDFHTVVQTCMRYSGIQENYLNEVISTLSNKTGANDSNSSFNRERSLRVA